MHDPISLLAVGSTAGVEHKGFSHSNPLGVTEVDGLVPPSGLPEAGRSRPVRPGSGRIFLVLMAKEVPIILWP